MTVSLTIVIACYNEKNIHQVYFVRPPQGFSIIDEIFIVSLNTMEIVYYLNNEFTKQASSYNTDKLVMKIGCTRFFLNFSLCGK